MPSSKDEDDNDDDDFNGDDNIDVPELEDEGTDVDAKTSPDRTTDSSEKS